jgi:hypothetical protein
VPTEKNAPARDFYERHGFCLLGEQEGAQEWQIEVGFGDVLPPPWLTLRVTPPVDSMVSVR